MTHVRGLIATWRHRAEGLRPYAPAVAVAFEHAAAELERALRAADADLLTLKQAARESGYSADHLGRLIRDGIVPNAGRRHAPRIRRADLPRKAVTLAATANASHLLGASATQVARSLING